MVAGGLLSPGVRVQWHPGLPDRRGLVSMLWLVRGGPQE